MVERIAMVVRGLFELSDSIGYDAVAQYRVLAASLRGRTELRIFAEDINPNNYLDIPVEHIARLRPWLEKSNDSIIIYHWCDGWPYLDAFILSLPSRLIIRWHNNTPPWFFAQYSIIPVVRTLRGFNSLLKIAQIPRVEFWVNSVYTARQLAVFGIETKRIHVVYPLSPFLTADQAQALVTTDASDKTDQPLKLLFVGRVVPHKGHKHLVATASMVQHVTGRKVRLTMVGRPDDNTARYVEEAKSLAESLLVDAFFPGELPFSTLARIYCESDAFVCLSEHEGFGLPIFEAMRVGLPVVGLRSTAIGEFLRSHPLAISSMDYGAAAVRVIAASEPSIRSAVVSWQHEHVLRHYSEDTVAKQIMAGLAGESDWLSIGGAPSAKIEEQVSAIELRLGRQLREAASELLSLREIPFDTVDRFVTRYDLESFRVIVSEAQREREREQGEFVRTAMAVTSNRRLLGRPLQLARRVATSLQAGLIYVLQRLSNETRAEFDRIDLNLGEIRRSIQSLRVLLASETGSAPFKTGSTFGDWAGVFNEDYFNGSAENSSYRLYARNACGPNRELAVTLQELFHPETALEVGCAVGHCVEALRELGVRAFGCDISHWAVEQAAVPYVKRFDIASESILGQYDLVFAYDVLQQIPSSRLKFVINNLWGACTKYLVLVLALHLEDKNSIGDPTHLIRHDHRWWKAFLQEECGIELDPVATGALDRSEHSQKFRYSGRVFVARKPVENIVGTSKTTSNTDYAH
jgi:glycosyltransferase involved in cell wall biosynthesis